MSFRAHGFITGRVGLDVGVIAESFLPDFTLDASLFERLPLCAPMKLPLPTTSVSARD